MGYQTHRLLTFGGTAWADAEEWQCGIRFDNHESDGPSENRDIAEAIGNYLTSQMIQTLGAGAAPTEFNGLGMGPTHRLSWVRFNKINSNGKYDDPDNPVTVDLQPVQGGQEGILKFPPQVAAAISWTTAKKRPPGAFGRIFLPVSNLNIEADGRLNGGQRNLLANAWAWHLRVLMQIVSNDRINDSWPIIASKVGDGSNTRITGVRVGDVLDTQRRRRNQLREAYSETVTVNYDEG